MEVTDIAAASISLSSAKLQLNVNLSLAKKTMDLQEIAAQQLLEMLPPPSGVGEYINVLA